MSSSASAVSINRSQDLALGIGQWVCTFLKSGKPPQSVIDKTLMFRKDALACGLSALALGTNAPRVFRELALASPFAAGQRLGTTKISLGATMYGLKSPVYGPFAARAMAAADREWDSNGTNFGFDPVRGNTAGEFGHNDFYGPMEVAAQMAGVDGKTLLLAFVAVDTIRGRLAEVFALRNYYIDHVLHGGIATAAVATALFGGSAEQVAQAISIPLFNAVPTRAIRAGKQLSDNKGASAAINSWIGLEGAIWVMAGFRGAGGGLNNPQNIMSLFEGGQPLLQRTDEAVPSSNKPYDGPFDLWLPLEGDDGWPIMSMHIKMGLYEHQSAGALQALHDVLAKNPELLDDISAIEKIEVGAYEPAYSIIGKAEKYVPDTRQSADHSMVYILASTLLKSRNKGLGWDAAMLLPEDYSKSALHNGELRQLMTPQRISFVHDAALDADYPEAIPSWIKIHTNGGKVIESGVVKFPLGHAKRQEAEFKLVHAAKLKKLSALAFGSNTTTQKVFARYDNLAAASNAELSGLHDYDLKISENDFDA